MVKHEFCTLSDHFYTILKFKSFDEGSMRYGPGVWKANVRVFEDPAFARDLSDLWVNSLSTATIKDGVWWEKCKVEFKKLIISHSRRWSCEKKRRIAELERALSH